MYIFLACDLGGYVGWIWDEDAQVWWSGKWIGRRNAVIIFRREYNAKAAMIAASQGGWDGTRIGFEFIFGMV